VQHEVSVARVHELLEQLGALVLGVDEDEHLARVRVLAQELQQAQEAVGLGPQLYKLRDVRVDDRAPAHLHLDGRVQQRAREGLHLARREIRATPV